MHIFRNSLLELKSYWQSHNKFIALYECQLINISDIFNQNANVIDIKNSSQFGVLIN